MLDPGLERANLRTLLGAKCLNAAAQDLDYLRRVGELPADNLLGAQVLLQSESEAVVEVADELERMMAGGEA
jgi:hypothetical protein